MRTPSHQIPLVGMLLAALLAVDAGSDPAAAKMTVADFYRGKTVNMVIGSTTGGGFDAYARIIGRYMTKYLPGKPAFVPQNLVGGGGFAAGHRVAAAAPHGISAHHPTRSSIRAWRSSQGQQRRFAYLGSASSGVEACLRIDAPAIFSRSAIEVILGAGTCVFLPEYAALLKNVWA